MYAAATRSTIRTTASASGLIDAAMRVCSSRRLSRRLLMTDSIQDGRTMSARTPVSAAPASPRKAPTTCWPSVPPSPVTVAGWPGWHRRRRREWHEDRPTFGEGAEIRGEVADDAVDLVPCRQVRHQPHHAEGQGRQDDDKHGNDRGDHREDAEGRGHDPRHEGVEPVDRRQHGVGDHAAQDERQERRPGPDHHGEDEQGRDNGKEPPPYGCRLNRREPAAQPPHSARECASTSGAGSATWTIGAVDTGTW